MTPKRKRIGLFGLLGTGNFGNDASFAAMLRLIRRDRPEADVVCICGNPGRIAETFAIEARAINWRPASEVGLRVSRWLLHLPREIISIISTLYECRSLDVLLIPGTGILDDFGTGPLGMPYWLFRWCCVARLCGAKVLFVSIGAGPIENPVSRWLMRSALSLSSYRSFRDEISKEYMAALKCDVGDAPVYPDVVFGLTLGAQSRGIGFDGGAPPVGIGVMSYNGWRSDKASDEQIYERYIETLGEFIAWLVTRGHQVRLFTGDDHDWQAVKDLLAHVRIKGGTWPFGKLIVEPVHCLEEVAVQIAQTEIVIATRFHNVVCALAMGRPVISLGYAKKNEVLLAQAGLDGLSQNIETANVHRLRSQFLHVVENRERLSRQVERMSHNFAIELNRQNDRLLRDYL